MTTLCLLGGIFVLRADERLMIGATPTPAGEILEFLKPQLAQQGVTLELKIFTDYVQPNLQLVEHRLDANLFQHRPFLAAFNREREGKLVALVPVLIAPMGAYSQKIATIDLLPEGASVAIPNDPTNAARALLLLARAGLVTLRDPADVLATARDVTGNPKHLKIRELEAAMLPRILPQVDLAIINTNYALAAGLDPTRDAKFLESPDSPYVNVLVARPDNKDTPAMAKLSAALQSPATRQFILEHFKGAVVPAR